MQLVFTFISFLLFAKAMGNEGHKCLTAAAGTFVLGFIGWVFMVIIVVFQIYTGKYKST